MSLINNYFSLVLLFFNLCCYSQSIQVEYNIKAKLPNISSSARKDESMNQAFKSIEEAFKYLNSMKMNLKANSKLSHFYGNNQLDSDYSPEVHQMAKIILGSENQYFCNLDKGVVIKWFNAYGQKFIIQDSIKTIKWKLSKETKIIGKYTCYKATSFYFTKNSSGDFKKEVTAWYAPEIPFPFGPKGFCNLPGLILELTDDRITYYSNSIKMETSSVQIPELPKGKLTTQDELDQFGQNVRENSPWQKN
ncbi:GLPGLI family protein [Mangrovimonas sp. YM274]|uniref:GLPGLI family protein n=1 Tax=Mangrovimonas sp. YM274 TaxID=3070660 RepID=UPI0027DAF34B|nr:GLPGLI family protein [Mangrovimonas sp. YM274]WMI68832.1 GLPGLI family protein [Mangrovimonas sp. YM274]